MRARLTVILLAAVTAAFTLLSAPAASAHNVLESTSPADGSTVDHTPAKVVLTFNNPSIATGTVIEVDGPSGNAAAGKPKLVNHKVTQALKPGSPAGKYTVHWRVTSIDGHPISGSFRFTSTAAGTGQATDTGRTSQAPAKTASPTAAATQDEDQSSGGNHWPWIALVVVVLAVGGGLTAMRRRTTRR